MRPAPARAPETALLLGGSSPQPDRSARSGDAGIGGLRLPARLLLPPLLLLFLLPVPTGVASAPPAPPAGVASIVAGIIVRDDATVAAIDATRSIRLPRFRDGRWRLVVTKSRYRLDVMAGDRLLKAFPVALGSEPAGAKEREGDGRTPEGSYRLLPHHASPAFGRCFYVCYPNEADLERGLATRLVDGATARRNRARLARGERPEPSTGLGGLILLHATKNRSVPGLTRTNWTLGCIAMEGADLEELLALCRASDRPILEIRP